MDNKITFLILSTKGSTVNRTSVSKKILFLCSLFFLFFLSVSVFYIHDYIKLKKQVLHARGLEKYFFNYKNKIGEQRRQIQNFACEINSLKTKITVLNGFEKKIRIIANLENAVNHDGLFGIGGAVPEDLDTELEISKNHDDLLREMHVQVEQLEHASLYQNKSFESLLKNLEDQRNFLASTPTIKPTTGWVSSVFGYRKSPFTGRREFHNGLDIATRSGTPIVATADGVVNYVGKKGLLGNLITLNHGHGIITRYGHIRKALVKRGAKVKRGEPIALVGSTGRSTGPHVHYEVRLNGVPVNPKKYIIN